jgi:hypothetical protein
MKRIGVWTAEQSKCDLNRFRSILAARNRGAAVSYARESGFNLERVLVLYDRQLSDLSKVEIETFRRKYGVARRYRHVMAHAAAENRAYWAQWFEFNPAGHKGYRSGRPA